MVAVIFERNPADDSLAVAAVAAVAKKKCREKVKNMKINVLKDKVSSSNISLLFVKSTKIKKNFHFFSSRLQNCNLITNYRNLIYIIGLPKIIIIKQFIVKKIEQTVWTRKSVSITRVKRHQINNQTTITNSHRRKKDLQQIYGVWAHTHVLMFSK